MNGLRAPVPPDPNPRIPVKMAENDQNTDTAMRDSPPAPPANGSSKEPVYGGYTRFELELEVSPDDAGPAGFLSDFLPMPMVFWR